MKIRLLYFLIVCMLAAKSRAWEMVAKPFPFFYDLSSNEIYDVYQDTEGLIWIGTTSSVAFYDGFRLRTFRSHEGSPLLLSNNNIRFIADSRSHVWITSEKGIILYDKFTGQMSGIGDARLSNSFIDDIKTDGQDKVWIAAHNRVYLSNADGSEIKQMNPFEGQNEFSLNGLYVDNEHNLWVLAKGGRVFRLKTDSGTFEQMPLFPEGGDALMMFQDKENRYWVGTWGLGLWQMFPDEGETVGCYQRCSIKSENGTDEKYVFGIVQDDFFGYLWVLAYNKMHALQYIPGEGMTEVDISHILDPHKMFTRIMKDCQGNLWIGSYDEGYTIYFDTSGVRNYPLHSIKENLGWDVNLVNLVADGQYVWLSQDRYGGLLYDIQTNKISKIEDNRLGELSFLVDSHSKGKIWAVSRYGGQIYELYHDAMNIKVQHAFDLSDVMKNYGRVLDLEEDAEGRLWVLTEKGLIYSRKDYGYWHHGVLPVDAPKAMRLGNNGEILCVARDKISAMTLDAETIKTRTIVDSLPLQSCEEITRMAVGQNDNLWLSSSFGRVLRFTDEMGLTHFEADSLVSDGSIQDLLCIGNDLWLMTNKKILYYDSLNDKVRTYDAGGDNVCVKAFRNRALCSDGKSGVYVGGHNGFVHILKTTGIERANQQITPIVTDVTVDGKSLFDMPQYKGKMTFQSVSLQPTARNIEIHFSKWEYVLGKGTSLQFRLNGAEKEWNDFQEKRPYAFYHRLSRGEYTFQVRMMSTDGNWGEPVDLMTIIRCPAWYETTIAYSVYLALLVLIFFLLCYYIFLKNKKKLHAELSYAKMNYLTADHELMNRLLKVVDSHLDDTEFDLEKLGVEMGMSKSTLHRKMKAAMDMTPLDFIRNVRLKRACDMLRGGTLTVSEVAYAVGFSNPKYFTKCFKQEFGMTPSEYAQKQRD